MPASQLPEAHARIGELERGLRRKAIRGRDLHAAKEIVNNAMVAWRVWMMIDRESAAQLLGEDY